MGIGPAPVAAVSTLYAHNNTLSLSWYSSARWRTAERRWRAWRAGRASVRRSPPSSEDARSDALRLRTSRVCLAVAWRPCVGRSPRPVLCLCLTSFSLPEDNFCDFTMALCVISAVLLVYGVFYGCANPVSMVGTGYEGITVTIDPTVPAENCGIILANFEVSFQKYFKKCSSDISGRPIVPIGIFCVVGSKPVYILFVRSFRNACSLIWY